MSCSCNASALRLFARGLVQVHHPEPGSSFALPIRSASSTRFAGVLVSQRRPLHASRALEDAEHSAPASAVLENPESSTEDNEPSATSTPTKLAGETLRTSTTTNEEYMTEARAKAAWRFKQQGFDWKAFRSKDPAVREKVDFSNFDWKHWQGKKQGTRQLGKLVDNLEAARAEDRAAVGVSPRDDDLSRGRNYRGRHAAPATATVRYPRAPEDGALPPLKKEEWMIQKEAMKAKFPDGWRPHKRLSPDALAGIRALNAQFPDVYTTQTLADKFAVSPEAIRRILKSKWVPSASEEEDRQQRWHRRGVNVWERKAELGIKPPKRWRDEGVAREPAYHDRKAAARRGREEYVRRERDAYMRSFNKGRQDTSGAASERGDAQPDGETPAEKAWRGKSQEERAGPPKDKETRGEPKGDIFDKTLTSERRD